MAREDKRASVRRENRPSGRSQWLEERRSQGSPVSRGQSQAGPRDQAGQRSCGDEMLRWGWMPAKCCCDSKARGWHGLLPGSRCPFPSRLCDGVDAHKWNRLLSLTSFAPQPAPQPLCLSILARQRVLCLLYTTWGMAGLPLSQEMSRAQTRVGHASRSQVLGRSLPLVLKIHSFIC